MSNTTKLDAAALQRLIDSAPERVEGAAPTKPGAGIFVRGGGVGAVVAASRELIRRRGAQKAPTKVPVGIRLSADVVARFKASGPGWQTRVDDALREWLDEHEPTT